MNPIYWPRWAGYALAVALCVAGIWLRNEIAVSFANRPLLIMMVLPIIVAAALGGLGPGLLATALIAGSAAWFIPPENSFSLAADYDRAQWVMLIVDGLLVSTLSEFLHRSIRRERERRRQLEMTQAALQRSEARLKLFVEHAPAALAMLDREMRYIVVSRRWLNDYGFPGRDIVGLSHYEVFPEISEYCREAHRRCLAGEVVRADEDRFKRADGTMQWLRWEVRPWYDQDGGISGIVIFSEDITALKQAKWELEQQRIRFSSVFDVVPDLFFLLGPNGVILDFKASRSSDLYLPAEQFLGRQMQAVLPPAVGKQFEEQQARARAGELARYEYSLSMPDGLRHFEARLARLPDSEQIIAVVRDISDIHRALAEIRRLNAGLEARVELRTAELTAAYQELESFAYAVSHDLRAPLRAMSGFSLALQEDYGDALTGDAKRYLDQIDLASRKMNELIDGLLTLSRSTRGELRRDPVDLSALARRRLDQLALSEPQRQVRTEVQPDLLAVGDVRMLEVVIENLIDNAWKYSGGTASPEIRVHAGSINGLHGICVSDNGAGFDMAHATRLFKPFQRLHRQEEFPGTGIGLATVHRIVHRHGGEIVAQSKPGEGACFCFSLPKLKLENPS